MSKSEPVSKQKRVQDWINQPYESQSHLQPLEDPSIILTSPQFPKKKYSESKIFTYKHYRVSDDVL